MGETGLQVEGKREKGLRLKFVFPLKLSQHCLELQLQVLTFFFRWHKGQEIAKWKKNSLPFKIYYISE